MKRFSRWCKRVELKHRIEGMLIEFFESQACLFLMLLLTLVIVLTLGTMIVVAIVY